VRIDGQTHFFELVQKTCQVRFSDLLRHVNLCKGPRTLQKFPQKIANTEDASKKGLWNLTCCTSCDNVVQKITYHKPFLQASSVFETSIESRSSSQQ